MHENDNSLCFHEGLLSQACDTFSSGCLWLSFLRNHTGYLLPLCWESSRDGPKPFNFFKPRHILFASYHTVYATIVVRCLVAG